MKAKLKILSIVGARPQFIKLMPISRELSRKKEIKHIVVHTGQHYDYLMSKVFFDELEIPEPDYNLGVGSGTHGFQTGEMIKGIEKVIIEEKPDICLVYGDTNSTLAGALAAVKLHIPVAHVEAGLRSFKKNMPEEINRILTDRISDILFCPTETAVKNLKKEGITQGVFLVGDVMYDALLISIKTAEKKWKNRRFERTNDLRTNDLMFDIRSKKYALATIHRAENTDDPERLKKIFTSLNKIADSILDAVVVPLHPRTQKAISKIGVKISRRVQIIPPLSYLDMLIFEKNAAIILTDSGGVQKEAYFMGVPCVTLRDETEWVELVKEGWNKIAGTNPEKIVEAVKGFLRSPPSRKSRIFDSGTPKRIVEALISSIHGISRTPAQGD